MAEDRPRSGKAVRPLLRSGSASCRFFRGSPGLFASCEKVAVPWEECAHGGPLAFVRRYPSLSSLGIVIGPEGGISAEETDALLAMGCESITLGKRILRTETAGLASLSAFFSLYGEMEQ